MNPDHAGTEEPVGSVAGLLAAWRDQLAELAPAFVRRIVEPPKVGLRLEFLEFGITLVVGGSRRVHLACDEPDPARTLRGALSAAAIGRLRDVVLCLSSSDVLRPTVHLPPASPRILRSALHYELERQSPIAPDELYFDFETVGRDPSSNTIDVELRAIRRTIVDDAVKTSRLAGLSVAAIQFSGDARPADSRVFPVDRNAVLRGFWRNWNVAILAGLAMSLLFALVLAAYLRGAAELDAISDAVVDAGVRAARVERLQHRIDQTRAQMAFLDSQRRAPLFVAILAEITRALPDGSWISGFDLAGNKVRIVGYSRAASDLIERFDRSGRFANAQFAAPITQGPSRDIERFDLTFDVVR